jgi:transposase InsO family protein
LGCFATQYLFIAFVTDLIESFTGRLKQECLNEIWFLSLEDAQEKVEAWGREYDQERPHSALVDLASLDTRCRRPGKWLDVLHDSHYDSNSPG